MIRYACLLLAGLVLMLQFGCGTTVSPGQRGLRTRARGEPTGTEIVVHGGIVASAVEVGAPEGTRIDVEDQFYNVPARRKFLRSTGTESGHVTDAVQSAALARPHITFTLERTVIVWSTGGISCA